MLWDGEEGEGVVLLSVTIRCYLVHFPSAFKFLKRGQNLLLALLDSVIQSLIESEYTNTEAKGINTVSLIASEEPLVCIK